MLLRPHPLLTPWRVEKAVSKVLHNTNEMILTHYKTVFMGSSRRAGILAVSAHGVIIALIYSFCHIRIREGSHE